MSISYSAFSSICEPLLAFLALLLQLITLSTPWWATFTARTDLGKPEENGHYGLWTLCSTKGPHWVEDCDPLDTFFETPPYVSVSGILCIANLILTVIFFLLGILRAVQLLKHEINFCIKAKVISIVEVSLSLSSTLIAVMITIFVSVSENNQKEYSVSKGWSFWIQVFAVFVHLALFSLCATDCIRFWQLQRRQHIDPEGKRAETYGNPSFDADSPELPRSQRANNGAIAFTESSGFPYGNESSSANPSVAKNVVKSTPKESVQTLTYENECYLESSPRSARRQLSS